MFGQTSPFGKPINSAFGPQSAFGQANNANNNPFVANSFGGTTSFGSPTGGSVFGGTSTGVFGGGFTQTPSLFSSRAAFGASPLPSFGGSSPFGQNSAFGFGSTPAQTSNFGTTSHPSQPTFESSIFGSSTLVGAQSQSEFSASSTPGFGSSTPAFPTTSTPAFGSSNSQPACESSIFGSSTPFGAKRQSEFSASSTPGFGSSIPAFRTTSTPASVTDRAPSFGITSIPAFGSTKAPIFGSGGAFGVSSNPAFGASFSSSLSLGSSPSIEPSKTAFRSNQFETKSHGAHIGSQVATPTFGRTEFGKSSLGSWYRGSRVAPFTATTEANTGVLAPGKLQSICSMNVPVYQYKSHEELRWEDYQWGDKGGSNHTGQSGVSVGPSASPAIPLATFGQTSNAASNAFSSAPASAATSNVFSFPTSSNELSMTAPNPFVLNPSSNARYRPSPSTFPFSSSSSLTSVVRSPPSALEVRASQSIFSSSVSATLGSSPSVISTPTNLSTQLFMSTTPVVAQTASAFSQTTTSFSQTTAPSGQTTTPAFGQKHTFSTAPSGSAGSLFLSTPSPVLTTSAAAISQTNPSFSLAFRTFEAAETSGARSLDNIGQTRAAGADGFGSQNAFGQSREQSSINGISSVVQPALVTNPFGTLPAVQQLSIGCTEIGSPVQYGISSMPVVDKPSPVRKSPLLSARHLSLRQTRLPARKYHPERGVQRDPFFYDGENTPSKPEADALLIPRGNPRSLVIGPEYWPAREQKPSLLKKTSPCANGGVPKDCPLEDQTYFVKASQKIKGVHEDSSSPNDEEYVVVKGSGEPAIGYDCGAGIEALMPKLCQPDYYTEPHVKELAAKETAEPGFCRRVKDFVVGRLGYGHIKFVGETDVRRLDLESLICFNNREVIVYTDESEKPPIGQRLNKPAEVTLLNIKCIDKKTGKQYIEGPKVENYKEMLKKKAEEQGAEFVSYDPVKGEWKFKVRHLN